MKTNIDNQVSPEIIAAILGAIQQQQQNNPLMDILGKKLARDEAEREEKDRQQKESRKQNALVQEQKRKQDIANQEACPHIKPNRTTNVVGQRDHSNNYHYFCQACQKHWGTSSEDEKLPNYLYPDPNMVGGPQF